jgi:hypothetical protein
VEKISGGKGMRILNLIQHNATKEQEQLGVFELSEIDKERIKELLTFAEIPTLDEIKTRAEKIAKIASTYKPRWTIIAGVPYLMSALEKALMEKGITPMYAFSRRVIEEVQKSNGSVEKKIIFRHEGFIEVSE